MGDRPAEEAVREAGLRMTPLKRGVIGLFRRGGCGLCATDVHRMLGGGWHISSVHRCLVSLEGAGVLRTDRSTDGVVRYRSAPELYPDHGHLSCTVCGGRFPVRFDPPQAFIREMERSHGMRVMRMDIHLEGCCSGCAAPERDGGTSGGESSP